MITYVYIYSYTHTVNDMLFLHVCLSLTYKIMIIVKGSWEVNTSVLRTNRMKGGVRPYIR